jgi:hypothetical protein
MYGLIGAILLTIGGSFSFYSLYLLELYFKGGGSEAIDNFFPSSIVGCLFIAFGLWIIILSGKPETKQTSS